MIFVMTNNLAFQIIIAGYALAKMWWYNLVRLESVAEICYTCHWEVDKSVFGNELFVNIYFNFL